MLRSLSTIAGIAAMAFAVTAGTAAAECFGAHGNVTASSSQAEEGTAMSTFDGQQPQQEDEAADEAQVAEVPDSDAPDADQDK